MESRMLAELVVDALAMAVERCRPANPVVHHSDQSLHSHYMSLAFGRCREAGVLQSMGFVGDMYDNAVCESFFDDARMRAAGPAAVRQCLRGAELGLPGGSGRRSVSGRWHTTLRLHHGA